MLKVLAVLNLKNNFISLKINNIPAGQEQVQTEIN
jgi:hypothetical protein